MEFSYKKVAVNVVILTFLLTTLLLVIAYRSEKTETKTYTLREYNGTVALYADNEVIDVYHGIIVSNLPMLDQVELKKGITLENIADAEQIIEDYDG